MNTQKIFASAVLGIAVVGSIVYLNAGKVSRDDVGEVVTIVPRSAEVPAAADAVAPIVDTVSDQPDAAPAPTSVTAPTKKATPIASDKSKKYELGKEITTPDGVINTAGAPVTIQQYIGKKIVLVDFWTYSCINCQRTTPYLNAWYEKYKDAGLVIVGVHTPEFDFEKVYDNVVEGTRKLGIQYPVVLDNDYSTWTAYRNRYWPRKYLIDIDGYIVYDHIGEGGYAETEKKIQELLAERNKVLGVATPIPTGIVDITQKIAANSPETYFGAGRNEYLANGTPGQAGVQTFARPADSAVRLNQLNLVGAWNFAGEYATNQSADARIIYKYQAKNVYFVASSKSGAKITVLRDGVPVSAQRGEDVDAQGNATIGASRLYKLISESDMQTHTLEIIVHDTGLEAYTFTFG